jgi:hypothetical protein
MNLQIAPITALKIFMFFFVGGLVGIGLLIVGGPPSLIPLVIMLAGVGAVAAIEVLFPASR